MSNITIEYVPGIQLVCSKKMSNLMCTVFQYSLGKSLLHSHHCAVARTVNMVMRLILYHYAGLVWLIAICLGLTSAQQVVSVTLLLRRSI